MSTVHGEEKGEEEEEEEEWFCMELFSSKNKGDFFLLSKSRRLYDS